MHYLHIILFGRLLKVSKSPLLSCELALASLSFHIFFSVEILACNCVEGKMVYIYVPESVGSYIHICLYVYTRGHIDRPDGIEQALSNLLGDALLLIRCLGVLAFADRVCISTYDDTR